MQRGIVEGMSDSNLVTYSTADVSHWHRDQLEDKYYRLYDENLSLKKDKHAIADANKLLTTRVRRLMSAAKLTGNTVNDGDECYAATGDQHQTNAGIDSTDTVAGNLVVNRPGIITNIRLDMPGHGVLTSTDNRRPTRAGAPTVGGKTGAVPGSSRRHKPGVGSAVLSNHGDQRRVSQSRTDSSVIHQRTEMEQLRRQLQMAEKAAMVLTEQNTHAEHEIEELKDQIEHIQSEHLSQMDEMKRQLELAGKSRLSGNVDLIKLQRQLKQLNLQLQQSVNRVVQVEQQLHSEQQRNDTLKQQNADNLSRADELQLKLDQVKLDSVSELNQLKQQLQRLQLTCDDLQEDNKLLRNANEKLTSAVSYHAEALPDQNQLKQLQLALDSERGKLVAMETALHSEQHRNRLLTDQLTSEQQRSWRQQHELMSRINMSDSCKSPVVAATSRQLVNVGTQTDVDKTADDVSPTKHFENYQHKRHLSPKLRTEDNELASGDGVGQVIGFAVTTGDKQYPSPNAELFREIDTGQDTVVQLTSLHSRYVSVVQQLEKSRELATVHTQLRTQLQTEVDVLNTRLTDMNATWRDKEKQLQQSLTNRDAQIASLQQQVRGNRLTSRRTGELPVTNDSDHRDTSLEPISRVLRLPHECANVFLHIDSLSFEPGFSARTESGAGGRCYLAVTIDNHPPSFSRSLIVDASVQKLVFQSSFLIRLQRKTSLSNELNKVDGRIEIFYSPIGKRKPSISATDAPAEEEKSDANCSTGTIVGSVEMSLAQCRQTYQKKQMEAVGVSGVGTLVYCLTLDASYQWTEIHDDSAVVSRDHPSAYNTDTPRPKPEHSQRSELEPQPATRRLPVVTSPPSDVAHDTPRPLPRQLPIGPIRSESRLPVPTSRAVIGGSAELAQPIKCGYETYTESSDSDAELNNANTADKSIIFKAATVDVSTENDQHNERKGVGGRMRRRASFVISGRPSSPTSAAAAVFNRPVVSGSDSDTHASEYPPTTTTTALQTGPHSTSSHSPAACSANSSHSCSDDAATYRDKVQTNDEPGSDAGSVIVDDKTAACHMVVCAEVHNASSPDEHQVATKCRCSDDSVASDSEGVVVCQPASARQGNSIAISVAWLKLGSAVDHLRDLSEERRPLVFVEYRFLDLSPEELESPVSLPLPGADKKMVFNFRKSISLDPDQHWERCRLLTDMLHKDNAIHGTGIVFSAVAEPPDTVQNDDAQCVDIGSAFVSLRDVVDSDVGSSAELQLDVRSPDGADIGCMCVCLEGVNVIRSVIGQ